MIVTKEQFAPVLNEVLPGKADYGLDCEATGLYPYQNDELFSIIIATDEESYYFDFLETLPRSLLPRLQSLFSQPKATWYIANAKYDMGLLWREGLSLAGTVHCTEACGRVLYNQYLRYGLDAAAKRIAMRKSDKVEDYVRKHKLYEHIAVPGKKKKVKKVYYNKVPLEIIAPYGESDAFLALNIGYHQGVSIARLNSRIARDLPKIRTIYDNERRLTKTCFRMERQGIRINPDFCREAITYEKERIEKAMLRFESHTGVEFKDSNKVLAEAFTKVDEKYPTTAKGNPSFTDAVLEKFVNPAAQMVREYRSAYKKAYTYYANFLYFADSNDRIHANIRQGGTDTGRVSYSDPNCQNLPKREEEDKTIKYRVRQAFIPTDSDWCFVMIDKDQMEYRLMLDYAAEMGLIQKVLDGLDVHQATADMMGVERYPAKTLNFMLLYGGGAQKLANALNVEIEEAYSLKNKYFRDLPNVISFVRRVIQTAERSGMVFNWAGRQCHFPDARFAYKAPNHLIQGGCADIIKFAMNDIDDFLAKEGTKTRLLLQVHDELLFEVHKSELDIVPHLKAIMERAYPYKHLPLTAGVSHSWKSWGDKVEGLPK